jgi:hypothetical protein
MRMKAELSVAGQSAPVPAPAPLKTVPRIE